MKPIYKPKGKAAEYGDYALNIYTGCPHRCFYCFAPQVLRRDREVFHGHVEPRKGIINDLKRQVAREKITGQLIHLCFTCDPYPVGCDTTVTREAIYVLKECGNHIQILTKGSGKRDFDLLDDRDWYGVTISCDSHMADIAEPNGIRPEDRLHDLRIAAHRGINTWVSFEPVLNERAVLECIKENGRYIDKVKIGKLNYHSSDINWARFGREAEALCKKMNLDYYIKDSLRAEMDKP